MPAIPSDPYTSNGNAKTPLPEAYGIYIYRQTVLGDLRISGQKRILRDRDSTIADRLLCPEQSGLATAYYLRSVYHGPEHRRPCGIAPGSLGRAAHTPVLAHGPPTSFFGRLGRSRRHVRSGCLLRRNFRLLPCHRPCIVRRFLVYAPDIPGDLFVRLLEPDLLRLILYGRSCGSRGRSLFSLGFLTYGGRRCEARG